MKHKDSKKPSKPAPAAPQGQAADATPQITGAPSVPQELLTELDLPIQHATLAKHDKKTDEGQLPLDDAKTDAAVDDIAKKESDEILAAEDAAAAERNVEPPRGFGARLKSGLAAWWHNKWARYGTILAIIAALTVVITVPTSRYWTLNTLGVRSSLSVVAIDDTTDLPLKNVAVSIGQAHGRTNSKGEGKLQQVRLGAQTLTLQRVGFAPVEQTITVGWGSNPLGEIKLKAVGRQFVITAKDFLSDKGLAGVQASSGDATALADENGKITLTLEDSETLAATVPVTISASGYRTENIILDGNSTAPVTVHVVPALKEVFISKQSGKYDVYTIDADGKNRQLLLAGTGAESTNMSLVVSPAGDAAALVSTRDNQQDSDGFRLSALTLINLNTGTAQTFDHAEQIQLIDWIGTRLIYQVGVAGSSAADPQRYRLISYDYKAAVRLQLASANLFNAVLSSGSQLFYATSSTDPAVQPGFFRINPDGTNRQKLLSQEVWSAFRVNETTLNLQAGADWYALDLGSTNPTRLNGSTAVASRHYVQSPDGNHKAWIDQRDGKGALLLAGTTDKLLHAQDGLVYPARWLNATTLIYRVVTPQETADYAVSVDGGAARKIVDVSPSYGFAQ